MIALSWSILSSVGARVLPASPQTALLHKPVVVPHQQMRLDLLERVQRHPHDDQKPGAPEEIAQPRIDAQVADDVLDVIGSNQDLGKTAGKDLQQGKNTYASLLGTEKATLYVGQLVAQAKQELAQWDERSSTLCALAEFIEKRIHQKR